ncbi:hypothetical protein EX30DRAFT_187079 [Ascodesmis nigricans]|uniref:Uncharacterized protein n=1 Tax=Ascodesmis nigricans TaxID=341454 RepID=A0A4V3SJ39_9PEZI|nr:hypothetical protein EX30DRAFT_187079 [Ascodesmis nigricans]
MCCQLDSSPIALLLPTWRQHSQALTASVVGIWLGVLYLRVVGEHPGLPFLPHGVNRNDDRALSGFSTQRLASTILLPHICHLSPPLPHTLVVRVWPCRSCSR